MGVVACDSVELDSYVCQCICKGVDHTLLPSWRCHLPQFTPRHSLAAWHGVLHGSCGQLSTPLFLVTFQTELYLRRVLERMNGSNGAHPAKRGQRQDSGTISCPVFLLITTIVCQYSHTGVVDSHLWNFLLLLTPRTEKMMGNY